MAKKRMLSNELWRDKKVIKLSNNALILWIAIITIADDEGIFEYDPEAWYYEIARRDITPDKISDAMDEIKSSQMVVMYGDGYGFIPSWYKHQSLSHPTATRLQRPPRSILINYPEYVALWQKTFTVYQKNENGERVAIVPEYPYSGELPETSGNFRKLPESFRKTPGSIDQSSIDQSSLVENIAPAAPSPSPQKRFEKPSLADVQAYCAERKNSVDPQKFVDYYESNGWRVGKNAMKDWRAAVRTWERNNQQVNSKVLLKPMLDMEEV